MKRRLIGICAIVLALALILTLTPGCGNGDEEVKPTPGPGVTPTPGVTPSPTPEVKTVKMALLTPLSGPAAPYGQEFEEGYNWAIDKINEAGGFKVGADTYIIKKAKGDSKYQGSVGATEATRLVLQEGCHYMVGPITIYQAIDPVLLQGKCFAVFGSNAELVYPGNPYMFVGATPVRMWSETSRLCPPGWRSPAPSGLLQVELLQRPIFPPGSPCESPPSSWEGCPPK